MADIENQPATTRPMSTDAMQAAGQPLPGEVIHNAVVSPMAGETAPEDPFAHPLEVSGPSIEAAFAQIRRTAGK